MSDDLDALDETVAGLTSGRVPFGSPRFARLVGSPAVRRLSPRRLAAGMVLVGLFGWGITELGSRVAGSVRSWVAAQPEHQISFEAIELDPPPPPYIRTGAPGILETIRQDARYGEKLPLLSTDLQAFRIAVSQNPWIELAGPVQSSYRRLVIRVVYRKPVAIVFPRQERSQGIVVDRNGVELPSKPYQFRWAEKDLRHRAEGDVRPLIEVFNVGLGRPDREGLIWRSAADGVEDDRVPQAARLAEFLAAHAGAKTPEGRSTPDFSKIYYYHKETEGFFLRDSSAHWYFWESAPRCEKVAEPRATDKWTHLGKYIDAQGTAGLHWGAEEYLRFSLDQVSVKPFKRVDPFRN